MNEVPFRINHVFTAILMRRVYADSLYGTAYSASEQACSTKVSSRVPHPYAYLRTGGLHSAEGLNRPPPHHPHPHPDTRSPSPSAQDLTHPSDNGLSQNALESVESPTRAVVCFFAFLSAR
jgi:hypothetical protein